MSAQNDQSSLHSQIKGQDKAGGGRQPDCTLNAEYLRLLDMAQRYIFDPRQAGNLKALESVHACDIKTTSDAITYANEALKATGDSFNKILTADQVAAMEADAHGQFGGIGATFEAAPGKTAQSPLVVHETIPNSPAFSAELKAGDVITAIDGHDVTHMKQQDALNLIGGDIGTPISIDIRRGDHNVSAMMIRQEINVPSVQGRQLHDGIAYLSVDNFEDETAAAQLETQMRKYKDAPAYVIDLRNNPGGLVDTALLAASIFVKNGTLVKEQLRVPSSSPVKYSQVRETLTRYGEVAVKQGPGFSIPRVSLHQRLDDISLNKPVVILVNENTASAAEMFTAAVHDNNPYATVVGAKTFGKGIGQIALKGLPGNAQMNITTMHYLTPNGKWLGDGAQHRYGVQPDQTLAPLPPDSHIGSDDDKQLQSALAILEKRIASKPEN